MVTRPLYICSLAVFLLLYPPAGRGQDVSAVAAVDSSSILIGDWLRMTVDVEFPDQAKITPPAPADSMHGIEIIRQEPPVTRSANQRTRQSFVYVLTSFDSGAHLIPSMGVRYTLPGDTLNHVAFTRPIAITVRGVAVDTSQEIKDIKPPLSIPLSFAEIAPYLIGAVFLGGLVWLFFYIRRRRKMGEPLIPDAPPRPADEIALEGLRALDAERLWQGGNVKQYHSQLTDLIRTYIERRFAVPAMEETSDETLMARPVQELPKESRLMLEEILVRADYVKFAKFQPAPSENESSMQQAVSFVEATRGQTAVLAGPHASAEVTG